MKNRIITGLLITAALAAGCNDELIPEAETTASGGIGDYGSINRSETCRGFIVVFHDDKGAQSDRCSVLFKYFGIR